MVSTSNTCSGWQIALQHMKHSGAECKIICPSKLGFTDQNSSVTPYGYDMKIQIKRF
jgi:FKBP-type peptidyl-prolyl cis-trans isomerase